MRRLFFIVLILLLNIGFDQGTKFLARHYLQDRNTVHVIGSYVILTYAENKGAFLGLGSVIPKPLRVTLLGIVPLLVLIVLFVYVLRSKDMRLLTLAGFGCILGGGVGNIAERLIRGYVVDFLNFGIGRLRTGILNIADLSVFVGVILVAFTLKKHEPTDSESVAPGDGNQSHKIDMDLDNN